MTFEEEFPSIKPEFRSFWHNHGAFYGQGVIQDYRLDKQRVREAIDKLRVLRNNFVEVDEALERLEEELGL